MAVKFANLASTTLAGSLTNSATAVSVTDASSFPALAAGDYFYASIGDGSLSEIVKVTAVSSNTFTVVRGQDGTTARSYDSGASIALRVVAAALDDIASQAQTAADTESVSRDGDSMTGDLSFGDNNKVILGSGNDLKLYHDGSDSYIDDTGTGRLRLRGAADIILAHPTNGETYATFSANGANTFYYDNSARLATSSTGIDVTGSVTADTLDIDNLKILSGQSTTPTNLASPLIYKTASHSDYGNGDLIIQARSSASRAIYMLTGTTTPVNRLRVGGNGDISFYDSSGTSQSLFWDSSAESLAIGVSAANARLEVGAFATTNSDIAYFSNSNGAHKGIIRLDANGDGELVLIDAGNNEDVVITAGGDSYFNGGNLLVGKTSAALAGAGTAILASGTHNVTVDGDTTLQLNRLTSDGAIATFFRDGSTAGIIATNSSRFELDGSGNPVRMKAGTSNIQVNNNTHISFDTAGGEAARFDSFGNLLVGTTNVNPAANNVTGHALKAGGLVEHANSGAMVMRLNRTDSSGSLIEFRQGTSAVGSIGASSGDLIIGTGDTGLYFWDGDDSVIPWNIDTNSSRDNGIDLGDANHRFKDLYLSGGAYLGGTVTANGLTVDGHGTFTTADNSAQVTLISTDADALVGPQLNLWRNSGTGTNGDLIGQITFTGEDTVGSTNTFASIYSVADQANNGAEDGSIHFQTLINGVLADRLEINSAGNTVVTGTVSSSGDITAGDSSTSASIRAHFNDSSYMTLEGYGLSMNRGASYIRPTTDGDKTLYIGGADDSLDWNQIHFRSLNGLYMTGTRFLTTGRDLQNIASIAVDGNVKLNGNYPVGVDNVVLGEGAGASVGTGAQDNVLIGDLAGNQLSSGDYNTCVGSNAGSAYTTHTNSVAIGNRAGVASTQTSQVLVGSKSGSTDPAFASTAVGFESLMMGESTGYRVTGLGYRAFRNNTTGQNNTGVGYQAGASNTTTSNNTYVGTYAGDGTAVGGGYNTAVGAYSLTSNLVTGSGYNTCVGGRSGLSVTSGSDNTLIGYGAGDSVSSGFDNTAVGYNALQAINTENGNVAVGHNALGSAYSTIESTCVGSGAGSTITTGSKNTILGAYSGNEDGLDIRTLSNRIVLADGDGSVGLYIDDSQDAHFDGNVIAYSTTISDRRLKSGITNISNALAKVGQINGVTFVRHHNGEKAAGIVAQEIMEVLPEAVKSQALPLQTGEQDKEYYVVEYDAVTGLLVEAVKELKARVEALESK